MSIELKCVLKCSCGAATETTCTLDRVFEVPGEVELIPKIPDGWRVVSSSLCFCPTCIIKPGNNYWAGR